MDFLGDFGLRHKIVHKAAPRYWHWWRGVVDNAFRLKRSYSMPVSTAMGDCLRAGTAIGFARPVSISSNFLFPTPLSFSALVRGDPLRIYGEA